MYIACAALKQIKHTWYVSPWVVQCVTHVGCILVMVTEKACWPLLYKINSTKAYPNLHWYYQKLAGAKFNSTSILNQPFPIFS